ncbi:orotate phosphoribosyltransferase [Alkalibaculum sp. M08DMB]|uniref:Orotate phosphoribosyltransferase n=1 Tax=Alkalibaculum sporogenes TaxID=2655001 RepID=A0A6A7KBD6_9FIRM|nr:orotate phosphoribosyltransferase [Alkalibaculum sporogenes]MPW26870.1 orotate phosphoribosyltransferase [Alkalibaculum sporogenes]
MSKEIINILKETEAFLEGHFLLSSGNHSGGYMQCAKVLRFPEKASQVLKPVVDQIKNLGIDKVVGPAMGGVIVAYEIGRQMNLEALFTERIDGEMQLRRGFEISKGDKVIIAEDVVTTGKSTIETKKALESLGAEVVGVACIVDRRHETINIDMPIYSAVKLDIEIYDPDTCPICWNGEKLVKPGSRDIAK